MDKMQDRIHLEKSNLAELYERLYDRVSGPRQSIHLNFYAVLFSVSVPNT
jgi:hypothetical protein